MTQDDQDQKKKPTPKDITPEPSEDAVPEAPRPNVTQPMRLAPDAQGRFNLKRTQIPQSKPVDPKSPTPLPFSIDETPLAGSPVVDAQAETRPYSGGEATVVGSRPPSSAEAKTEVYTGGEATLVGGVPPRTTDARPYGGDEATLVGGVAPLSSAPAADAPYTGAEATQIPVSRPAGPYTGNEATMVGMPTGPKPMDLAPTGPWMGAEATAVGTPVDPALKSQVDAASAPQPKSATKTTATMDDGWHLKGRKGPMTGQVFGDYEVGGILGEGGMGTVYRARQISLKRRVALKVLPPNLSHDLRLRERFEAEARTASLINNVNVVQVFAAGTIDDVSFFVMEFVDGTDLNEIIKERQAKNEPFAPEEAADYIIQAARGLAEAGRHGVVHRDIKPANLMVTGKGVVKIADFGISKVAGEHGLTMTGTAVGTPAYCSPEQGRGDPVDPRSDLYSLGVVLYELLTGQKPFDGATANALIYQHNYAEPKLPTEIRPGLGEEYQAIALKCLQKDPEKRYQDASELVGDLERVRAGSAPMTALLSAFGTGADEAMKRLGIKQRKTWPYVLAATLVLGGLGGGYWWWSADQAQRGERNALRDKLAAVIDAAVEHEGWVDDDLATYAAMVGEDDANVLRWRKEVGEVAAIEGRLTALDDQALPVHALRVASAADLLSHATYVGSEGIRHQRWKARLDQASAREAELRGSLSQRIDQGGTITLAAVDELRPAVGQFRSLAGTEDADGKRWEERLGQTTARAEALRGRLATLNQAGDGVPERSLAALSTDLDAYRGLAGERDADVVRWANGLVTARAVLSGLRESLGRLDAAARNGLVDLATVSVVQADLERYTTLADPEDIQLKRWRDLVNGSLARVEALKTQLSRLDDDEGLTLVEQKAFTTILADYANLVGTADRGYQAWSRRLARDAARVEGDTQALARLDDARRLTLAEATQLRAALERLALAGAIEPVRAQRGRGRVESDLQHIESLRAGIAAREGANGFALDRDLGQRIQEFVDLAGADDADAKRWRVVAAEYFRLHGALAILDQAQPVPDKVDETLTAYAGIVGDDEDVRRWRGKVQRVRELKQALAGLDRVQPLGERADADSAELLALVGGADLDAPRWRAKVERVLALDAALAPILADPTRMVLDPETINRTGPAVRELVALVGRRDEGADLLALRAAALEGPPQPTWASEFGRDRFGLYATAQVANLRLRFRYIPAGDIIVGSPEGEEGRDGDETQQAMRLTRSYWLSETEAIQALCAALAIENPSRFKGHERPIERISWDETQNLLLALGREVDGLNPRLPTEMEWEYACRAGGAGAYHGHEGAVAAAQLPDIAWYAGTSGGTTHPVAGRYPNRLGLFDLHGNVWEWCADSFAPYSPAITVDWEGRGGKQRVVRGGSWADQPKALRAANRLGIEPQLKTLYVGFRIAANVDWGDQDGMNVLRHLDRGLVRRGAETTESESPLSPVVDPGVAPAILIGTGSPTEVAPAVPVEAEPADGQPAPIEATPEPQSEAPPAGGPKPVFVPVVP